MAIVLIAFAVRCSDRGDERGELHCENAVAALRSCCPGFQVGAEYCRYDYQSGCNASLVVPGESSEWFPAISEDDASCIVDASCAHLIDSGTCERAMQAQRRPVDSSSNLCP